MSNPRSTASSVREQKLARVIDREVAPVWHDRFARMLLRELPSDPEQFALDVHSGPGHTTAELLQRLDESSRIVALGRDPWLMQVSKTRVRPEWKRRVYFKSGDIDDVTQMNDDTYDLSVANLVLGEQVVEWQPALAELMRVTKPGGQVLVTLPLHGTWTEVEDLFEELLRDEGMRKEVATLQKLRRRRPKPGQLNTGVLNLGLSDRDFIIEHERFELLFRSGREFLFAPVIEHGPLRLWKAILGQAEKPQALFWRFKEAIDTYYYGRVLSVTVMAGLLRVRIPGGPDAASYAGAYWSRYPSLSRLWGIEDAASEPEEEEFDLDLDIDLDEAFESVAPGSSQPHPAAKPEPADPGLSGTDLQNPGFGRGFEDIEVSGANELPAVDIGVAEDDPFSGLLEELDAEAAVKAEVEAEDAVVRPRKRQPTGRAATLGAAIDDGSVATPAATAPKPGDSGVSPRPVKRSGSGKLSHRVQQTSGESGARPIPKIGPIGKGGKLSDRIKSASESGSRPIPKLGSLGKGGKLSDRIKKAAPPPPPSTGSAPKPVPKPPKAATGGPQPQVTKPGEDDPFADMLADDDDELEEIDEIEELPEDSLVHGELDDDDFADSFDNIEPDPSAGRSGSRPRKPPPPPPRSKKK